MRVLQEKIVIVLQNIVTFRGSWASILNDKSHIRPYLVTAEQGNANLTNENRQAFFDVIVCQEFNYDHVLSACYKILSDNQSINTSNIKIITNDEYFLGLAADVRETLGVDGISKAHVTPFIDKIAMKDAVGRSNIRIPKAVKYDPDQFLNNMDGYIRSVEEQLDYPMFAKQIDSAGSEDISKLPNNSAFKKWCVTNKNKSNYEIDEYIEGELYHIDCLIHDNQIIDKIVCHYSCPNAEFIYGRPLGSINLVETDHLYPILTEANKTILDAFDCIPSGATHLEVFVTSDNQVVFLEIAARAPGGWIPQMHKINSGYHIEELHFLLQMGEFNGLNRSVQSNAAWLWFPQIANTMVRKVLPSDVKSNVQISWDLQEGERQLEPKSVRDKVCGILIENDNNQLLLEDYDYLINNFYPYT